MSKVKTIRKYYDLWIAGSRDGMEELLAQNIVYTESYGPQHHGLSEVIKWFDDWTQKAKVLCWDITNCIEQENICVVEWLFRFEMDEEERVMAGVSIAEFDQNGRIISMREFQSTHEHYYPYR